MSNIFKRNMHTTGEPTKESEEKIAEELANVSGTAVESVLKIADKYGKDRDDLCHAFARALSISIMIGSFKNYKFGGNEK